MIGYGELFKIFVIIVVVFVVVLMGIYLFRKIRDALTNEDRRDKEYRRKMRELERTRKYNSKMKSKKNRVHLIDKGFNTFGETVKTFNDKDGVVGQLVNKFASDNN